MNHTTDPATLPPESQGSENDAPGAGQEEARVNPDELREQIIDALREVYDPELPVNIYDLGLIYTCDVDEQGRAYVEMTLTAPGCPVAQTFPYSVECAVRAVPGVTQAHVELVWEPPWTQERMSETARLQLGFF
ncbi:MAG: SUF system Fe-S cluster assembly protein [Gammaproteobacteria bacterium]|nr:SUF system Fe-S cluster assembly protein [Gammaproteobacteria bacterium]